MTVLHSGSTIEYSGNWARAFGEPGKKKSKKKAASSRGTAAKKSTKKKATAKKATPVKRKVKKKK